MALFCLINPGLNALLDIELNRMTDIPEFPEVFIANYLNAGNLPAMSDRYYFLSEINIADQWPMHTATRGKFLNLQDSSNDYRQDYLQKNCIFRNFAFYNFC